MALVVAFREPTNRLVVVPGPHVQTQAIEDFLEVPQGEFSLSRNEYSGREGGRSSTLRAWDAADEYVLRHLAESDLGPSVGATLLVNDGFGALAVALADLAPASTTDSLVAMTAAGRNLSANDRPTTVRFLSSVETPEPANGSIFHLVVIKIPKTLALLEDQLRRLRPFVDATTTIVGAGMVKTIHRSTLDLFESIIGPTTTSLAKKKARLIFATAADSTLAEYAAEPATYVHDGITVVNHANVFARGKLDIGTRLLLDHLPMVPPPTAGAEPNIIELGCGDGIVGVTLARQHPEHRVLLTDESFMAVESARATSVSAGVAERCEFSVADGLDSVDTGSIDLVVLNPPFHEQQALGDTAALQMFSDARRVLRPGGELRVVGNRHLGYHNVLRRMFGNVETIGSNAKFVVLRSRRE